MYLKLFFSVLTSMVSVFSVADEPAWPANFDEAIATRVSSTTPSGDRVATYSVVGFSVVPSYISKSNGVGNEEAAFDSRFCIVRESVGRNMSSYPMGSVICIR